jgi:Leucine-rich repeat (LRR) protein
MACILQERQRKTLGYSAARTTSWRHNSQLQGGGMLAVDGVAHLDLSNRLITEQVWATKRHGDGSHPDTLWTTAAAPRSRVAIMAQMLSEHSTSLQSLDASNNKFGSANDKSMYAAKANRVLNREHLKGGTKRTNARPRTAGGAPKQQSQQRQVEAAPLLSDADLILALGSQEQLTTVDLSNNRIGLQGAHCLAEVLSRPSCQIANLVLSGNRIGDAAVAELAGSLGCSLNLRTVNLRDCAIGDAGAVELADYFSINMRVQVLDLSWNHIRARGGKALAACIMTNESLTDLDIGWNGLGDEPLQPGATEIGGSLAKNTTLTRLDLSHNRISEQGAFVIADGMGERAFPVYTPSILAIYP